jgi:hypothetical protein
MDASWSMDRQDPGKVESRNSRRLFNSGNPRAGPDNLIANGVDHGMEKGLG